MFARPHFGFYSSYVNRHLIPGIGNLPLVRLSPMKLQGFIKQQLAAGVSAKTVRDGRVALRVALSRAHRLGLVSQNVAKLVEVPPVAKTHIKPLSEDEARCFINGIHEDPWEALYLLALTVGLRQGEALGLRWQDVDLDAKVIHVRVQLQRTGAEFQLVAPKTEKSRADLVIPPTVSRLSALMLIGRCGPSNARVRRSMSGETRGIWSSRRVPADH